MFPSQLFSSWPSFPNFQVVLPEHQAFFVSSNPNALPFRDRPRCSRLGFLNIRYFRWAARSYTEVAIVDSQHHSLETWCLGERGSLLFYGVIADTKNYKMSWRTSPFRSCLFSSTHLSQSTTIFTSLPLVGWSISQSHYFNFNFTT